jgi:putative exosortase-associated protein (TIGR04073 family)
MTHSLRAVFAGACVLTLLLAQASFAGQPVQGEPEATVKLASVKLWRGIVNTVTGIGEVIRQPIVCTMEDGCVGVPVGLINGVFMTVVRVSAGVLEIVTFPVALDKSVGFNSLMNPDYVWQPAD